MMLRYFVTLVFAFSAVAFGASENISKTNGSIRLDSGQQAGDVRTVNGSIKLGSDAAARRVATLNGSIRLGERARVQEVETVNGSFYADELASVGASVQVVNGKIRLAKGAQVGGDLSNVNGGMTLAGAEVGGRLETVNGDITVAAGSVVRQGIHVQKAGWGSRSGKSRPPRVRIESGAVVNGPLHFEREVELYVGAGVEFDQIQGVQPTRHDL